VRWARSWLRLAHHDERLLARRGGHEHALARDWLRTGDLGFIDERGCLRLAGRLKEMFIRGGYNVYPAEVEAVLADHPLVADVAIVPGPTT
jgi:acyl-CoA synthetase (AMP-forming)/AMP-acid ligase II